MGLDMTRGINRSSFLAAVAVFGAMVAGGSAASAGTTGVVVTGSGGFVPHTDPQAYYEFSVTLAAGYEFKPGDFFKVEGLLGVTPYISPAQPGSQTIQPSPFGSPAITVTSISGGIDTSSAEWENPLTIAGSPGITLGGSGATFLGDFYIYTTQSISSLPEYVTVVAQSHNASGQVYTQTDSIMIASVPEPSSFLLLLAGMGLIPVVMYRGRRGAARLSRAS